MSSGLKARIFEGPSLGENAVTESGNADLIGINGTFSIGSQYHFTLEPQTTFCIPSEDGGIDVHASTQWIDITQIAIAETLNIPQNRISITVRRLGGAYGAKITRATQIACACALASHLTQRPVRFVLSIEANMMVCGKRFACHSDYSLAVEKASGKIRSLTNEFIEDGGCSTNEVLLPYSAEAFYNCYRPQPNWMIKTSLAKTDTPSTTWTRAPMFTEGLAMIENIMEHIAWSVQKDPTTVRLANMVDDGPMKKAYEDFLRDVGEPLLVI